MKGKKHWMHMHSIGDVVPESHFEQLANSFLELQGKRRFTVGTCEWRLFPGKVIYKVIYDITHELVNNTSKNAKTPPKTSPWLGCEWVLLLPVNKS